MKLTVPVRVWKYLLLAACAFLVFFVGAWVCYRVFIKNRSNIDLSEYGFVREYLHDTYGGDYTLDRGLYMCYDRGITANMRQYYFYVTNTDGKQYVAHYCEFAPLNTETVGKMTFEEVTA